MHIFIRPQTHTLAKHTHVDASHGWGGSVPWPLRAACFGNVKRPKVLYVLQSALLRSARYNYIEVLRDPSGIGILE